MNIWNSKTYNYSKLAGWFVIINILCFMPGNELHKVHIPIPFFDKFVHFVMFFVLGFLIKGLYWKKQIIYQVYKAFIVLAVLYGGLIEIIQFNWVYMRSGDWIDWLFDCLGIAVSLFLFRFWPEKMKVILG